MTMKQVRFVKADSRNPVQEIAELAVFDASGKPVTPPTNATKATPGLVKQAAHVAPSSATAQQVAQALIDAGIMASS